tara:strand:- start:5851 stop:6279 length:429 start_codon:yes stop_codon:yes gene_type:complete
MDVQLNIVKTNDEKNLALNIRREVFIKGLNIPEHLEIDSNEESSKYILAKVDGKSVGTARWRKTDEGMKLERFAVLNDYRSIGIGTMMTKFILNQLKNSKLIYLNAQESAISFYEKMGFKPIGPRFKEVNIEHQKMIYSKDS